MREITDPFKGKTYSQILEGLSGEARKAYFEAPHPILPVPGTATAQWDETIGRWTV